MSRFLIYICFKFYFFSLFFYNVRGINISAQTPLYYPTTPNDTIVLNHYTKNECNTSNGASYQWTNGHLLSYSKPQLKLNHLLSVLPTFEESVPIHSSNNLCASHSRFVVQKAQDLELWALKMFDSSGKIAAGMLNGNVNQMGDFDQCINAIGYYQNHTTKKNAPEIYGKYCLAAIDFTLPESLKHIDLLLHSHNIIRSKLSDPYHRIPKYSSMYWALCIPDSCSNEDVKEMINSKLEKLNITGLTKEISVEDYNCHTLNAPSSFHFGAILTTFFFLGIIAFVAFATIYDYAYVKKEEANEMEKMEMYDILMKSFSLKTTVNQLLELDGSPDDVACLHGVRAVNAIALLLSHKSMQLLFYPYVNRTPMTEYISYPWSMVGRSAIVYTDSFVMISGCLAAQTFLKIFDRKQRKIVSNYISRFLRLTPNLAAIILFCTFILPLMGSGPLWNNVITKHADLCRKNWWKNLLYVHNYFGFEEMCLTHTHQLGIDMQLYLFSPLLVYILWRSPALGIIISISISGISTYLRYYVTLKNNLSPIIYFGVSVSQLFSTASHSYILPTHRATVYIMGILLGYYVHYRSRTPIKLTYIQVQAGTLLATILGFCAMFGPSWMSNRHYKYNPKEAAAYMAYTPVIWCTALIWGIFININSYTGYVGKFFQWRGFRVFTRIAYAVYLVQFPVYFYSVGSNRAPRYFTTQVLFNIEEYTVIFALSTVLTLLFDLPFQNITKLVKLKSAKQQMKKIIDKEKEKLK